MKERKLSEKAWLGSVIVMFVLRQRMISSTM